MTFLAYKLSKFNIMGIFPNLQDCLSHHTEEPSCSLLPFLEGSLLLWHFGMVLGQANFFC